MIVSSKRICAQNNAVGGNTKLARLIVWLLDSLLRQERCHWR